MKIAVRLFDGRGFAPVVSTVDPIPARSTGGPASPSPWSDEPGLHVLSEPIKLELNRLGRSAARRAWRKLNGIPEPRPDRVKRPEGEPAPPPVGRRSDVDAENLRLRQESPLVIVNAIDRGTCAFAMSLTGKDTGAHEFCGEAIFASPSKLSFCAHHLTVALLPRSPSYRLARSTLVCELPDVHGSGGVTPSITVIA